MITVDLLVLVMVHMARGLTYTECREKCVSNRLCKSAVYGSNGCTIFVTKGTSEDNPGDSCLDILSAGGSAANGVYWVNSGGGPVQTSCDMDAGGWTLIGENGGYTAGMHTTWLRSNVNTGNLAEGTTIASGQYACIDAVDMAVNKATKVRLSSEGENWGMGPRWTEWDLPEGREVSTFWNVDAVAYFSGIVSLEVAVTVTSDDGLTSPCFHNKYGLGPRHDHGAPYPAATYETTGLAQGNDRCMTVFTMPSGLNYNGWRGGANGRDCPKDNADWPNANYGTDCFLAVWIK